MSDEKVVYRASPGQPAEAALQLLTNAGLAARALDPIYPDPQVGYAAGRSYAVRIAVPEAERVAAAELLQAWEAGHAGRVARQAAQFWRQLGLGLVLATTSSGVLVVLPHVLRDGWDAGVLENWVATSILGTFILLILMSILQERRRRAQMRPACDNCGYPLVGLSEPRCPECGEVFDRKLLRHAGRNKRN